MNLMLTQGNALRIPLADESVHCVVTSPPYWGLRDYGIGDQLGLEPTPEQYVANMVAVFREVRRVLRADGTVWLNLGDSYVSQPAGNKTPSGFQQKSTAGQTGALVQMGNKIKPDFGGLKPKDLCGIPWRVAFALQADGWWLRDAIPWVKAWMKTDDVPMWDMPVENVLEGSAMPGSQQDRPTTSYEMIFLLTKSQRYYFDSDAIKAESGAMFRNVWRMNPQSYKGAHFATFTPQLPNYAIQFGTSERGVCPECGKPWERVVEKEYLSPIILTGTEEGRYSEGRNRNVTRMGDGVNVSTLGWRPTCDCIVMCKDRDGQHHWKVNCWECDHEGEQHDPIPAKVFDPFAGSGTTLQVARALGRNGVGLDLSLEYLHLARERLSLDALDAWGKAKRDGVAVTDLPMFQELP